MPTIALKVSDLTSWQYRATDRGKYESVTAKYYDDQAAEAHKVTAGSGDPALTLNKQFKDEASAWAAANAKLNALKRGKATMILTLPGRADLERAARFLYLQRTAYGGKPSGQHFGVTRSRGARFNLSTLEPMLVEIHQRLAGVVIECLNYDVFIQRYDQAESLFYIDPPYWGCKDYYGKGLFSKDDFIRLNTLLEGVKGRFILCLNDVPEVRDIFSAFKIESVDTKYSMASSTGYKNVKEVIITN